MKTSSLPLSTVLAAGVGMGVAGDTLLRAPGNPGLAFALLFAGVAASVGMVAWAGQRHLSLEARVWLVVGVLFGALIAWRGSSLLRFLAFVSAGAAFTLPALRAGRAWLASARAVDVVEALVGAALNTGLGGVRLLRPGAWATVGTDEARGTTRAVARTVAAGLLVAAVPLLVFGGLFASADRVFAEVLQEVVRVDLGALVGHVVLTGALSWFACGYLAGFHSGTNLDALRGRGWALPRLGIGTTAVALGLVDLLFLAFVAVQFGALFGGSAWVEQTAGLTYATYAREGFFQLVAATALGLPWLLALHALLDDPGPTARWVFQAFAGVQVVLLLAIVASAALRLSAYLDAYGITEDRFIAAATLGWLALLVAGFGLTVLRGRRTVFTAGALVSGFLLVAGLQVANPAARSAVDLLDRAPTAELDVRYLADLGSDAVPVVLARFDELRVADRCFLAGRLLSRWGVEGSPDWRSWNRADARARALIRARADRLAAAHQAPECT